jgi:uncharacterized protein YlzI (FlbEa/FlbD family)
MKKFHRINGKVIWINPNHVRFVEQNPDTTLIFEDGQRLLVREDLPDTLQLLEQRIVSIASDSQSDSQSISQAETTQMMETRPWS